MIKCNYVICGEKNIIFITKTVHNRKTDIAQSVERLLHYVLAMGKGSIKTSIIIISPTINEFQLKFVTRTEAIESDANFVEQK